MTAIASGYTSEPDFIQGNTLLQQTAKGDEQAFTQLVEKHWQKVLQHALSFVKNYAVAEELTQDIFLQVWRKREKLAEVESFENYLFILSKNLLITHIRKKLVATLSIQEAALEELDLRPDTQFDVKEISKILQKATDLLPEPRRSVFVMSRVEGHDTSYISQKLGLAMRTVRWHLVHALNFMRTYLHYQANQKILILLAVLKIFF